jgi:hypothetical protein
MTAQSVMLTAAPVMHGSIFIAAPHRTAKRGKKKAGWLAGWLLAAMAAHVRFVAQLSLEEQNMPW